MKEEVLKGHFGELLKMKMAGSTGIEPAISGVTGLHVRPLHHDPAQGNDIKKLFRM